MDVGRAGLEAVRFAVVLPVGPGDHEVSRTADLVDALRSHAGAPFALVVVDDGVEERPSLGNLSLPGGCVAVVLRHPRRLPGQVAPRTYTRSRGVSPAVLAGFGWVAAHTSNIRFAMKLDTDSLVIGPFYERLASFFDQRPEIGVAGAFDRTPAGTRRDFSPHATTLRRLYRAARSSWWFPWPRENGASRRLGEHVVAAVRHGYRFGEHCLGGGYGVSPELLRRMASRGFFDDPSLWIPVDCPEDVMMGMYTRAVGLHSANYVRPGEVFGVRYRGLPAPPADLLARGYAVIHSVKNDPRMSEADIRAFFRRHRSERSEA